MNKDLKEIVKKAVEINEKVEDKIKEKEGEKNDLLDLEQIEMLLTLNKLERVLLERLYNNKIRENWR